MTPSTMRRRAGAATVVTALAAIGATALAAPAAAQVPGLTHVYATSVSNSDAKSATATCPAGKRVLGSGFEFEGADGYLMLDDLIPTVDTVTATGYEKAGGTTQNWTVRAWATCGSPPGSSHTVSRVTGYDSDNKSVTATCAAGEKVSGVGAELTGSLGHVTIDEIIPTADSVSASTFERDLNYSGSYSLRVFATCITPPPGLQIVSAVNTAIAVDKEARAYCPSGKRVVGTAFDIEGGAGDPFVSDLVPGWTEVLARATEQPEIGPADGGWNFRSYAICVNTL